MIDLKQHDVHIINQPGAVPLRLPVKVACSHTGDEATRTAASFSARPESWHCYRREILQSMKHQGPEPPGSTQRSHPDPKLSGETFLAES